MGIHKLMSLIDEKAPKAIKEIKLDILTGKVVAIDASMAMYQFLISTQTISKGYGVSELKDKEGNLTGHLVGLLNRTITLLEHGIKPVWVFDGKPPEMKAGELGARKEKKEKAEKELEEAKENGDMEAVQKLAQRSIRVSPQMTADAKKLIELCGIPAVSAPSEAEAQCAQMVKDGLAHATVTEDMDALTFGTNILIRGFGSRKDPIRMVTLDKVLEGFNMNMDEFIDLCIMCGCDYTKSIIGVGPIKAFKYIEKHKDIESTLEAIEKENESRKKKFVVPDNFLYKESRNMFKNPEVTKGEDITLKWDVPNSEGLTEFLIADKGFGESTVNNALAKFKKVKGKANQQRLDSFFTVKTKQSTSKNTVSKKKK
jgi:flap endonuclease-1